MVTLRHGDTGHHRRAYTEHQTDARNHHIQRRNDVDRRDAVRPYPLAYKDAVDNGEQRIEQQSQQGGEEYLSKQRHDAPVGVIQPRFGVFLFHHKPFLFSQVQ